MAVQVLLKQSKFLLLEVGVLCALLIAPAEGWWLSSGKAVLPSWSDLRMTGQNSDHSSVSVGILVGFSVKSMIMISICELQFGS